MIPDVHFPEKMDGEREPSRLSPMSRTPPRPVRYFFDFRELCRLPKEKELDAQRGRSPPFRKALSTGPAIVKREKSVRPSAFDGGRISVALPSRRNITTPHFFAIL
jgi:hypothetical protein